MIIRVNLLLIYSCKYARKSIKKHLQWDIICNKKLYFAEESMVYVILY